MNALFVIVVLLNACGVASILFVLKEANTGVPISELAVYLTVTVAALLLSIVLVCGALIGG